MPGEATNFVGSIFKLCLYKQVSENWSVIMFILRKNYLPFLPPKKKPPALTPPPPLTTIKYTE